MFIAERIGKEVKAGEVGAVGFSQGEKMHSSYGRTKREGAPNV